ncbi:alpha/beta fold hydrolase [Planctomicrobium sp. SH661]|uniref:alpha/beta fold hydrolase n=1 Tax=Planctomicrobium sp. SH661 TaxID=3448124 RepID=UPI003F5C5442
MNETTPQPKVEPCPAPLAWQEIAQSFHESAQSRVMSTTLADVKVMEFGTGRPIVFFPSICGSSRLFCLTAWLLKEEYRSILIESPQFHRKTSPATLVKQTAETLAMVTEHLVSDGADVYASGFSSQVALEMMSSRPKIIRSAFLQGAWAHRSLNAVERSVLQVCRMTRRPLNRMPLWQSMQIENHRRWFPPFDETRFGFLLQEAGETPTCELAKRFLAAHQTDLRPRLNTISQPVLILHCEGEGRQVAAAEEEMEQLLPHVEREEMYHSGHFPYLTHPHRLVKILKPFLSRQG